MTESLFRADPYLKEAAATVIALTDQGGIVLDRSLFYPTSGGQTGDCGKLVSGERSIEIVTTVKDGPDGIVLVPKTGQVLPDVGASVSQVLDWEKRHRMMRLHTGLHLLSVVIPLPVTGGQITPEKGRLDFDMPEAPADKDALEAQLNTLIAQDHLVTEDAITDAELDAKPELVKTMSVQPPRGSGTIRLIRIGSGDGQVDLQPCGGTHVKSTAEIGTVRFGKIEKKGRQNRRVSLFLVD